MPERGSPAVSRDEMHDELAMNSGEAQKDAWALIPINSGMRRHVRERLRTGLFVERMRRDARQGTLAVQSSGFEIIPSQYWYSKHRGQIA